MESPTRRMRTGRAPAAAAAPPLTPADPPGVKGRAVADEPRGTPDAEGTTAEADGISRGSSETASATTGTTTNDRQPANLPRWIGVSTRWKESGGDGHDDRQPGRQQRHPLQMGPLGGHDQ